MPRGGKRQGTPGKGYSNRTDLQTNYDNTASAAGVPSADPSAPPVPAGPPMRTPDQSPMLTDPTQRPDEPITAGLPTGAGPGPVDPRPQETQQLKKYLPLIEPYLNKPDTPDSVKALFRYIRGS